MFQDFGNHLVDERVVDLNPAALHRFCEDIVDEADRGLVARLVASERGDARVELLIGQKREEGDLQRRVCDTRARRRIPRILDVANADARRGVGRRRPVDDHL